MFTLVRLGQGRSHWSFVIGLILSLLIAGCGQSSPESSSSPTTKPTPRQSTNASGNSDGQSQPTIPITQPTPTSPAAPIVGLDNPASTYCIVQGGRLEIEATANGDQIGFCNFSDGTRCEEWAFYRGECRPGERYDLPPTTTATEPALTPLSEVFAAMQASLPANAFDTIAAQPLQTTDGRQLWVVYSTGMRNVDLNPVPSHVVAIYANQAGRWQELDRVALNTADAEPDYIGDVQQVEIAPGQIWLQIEGGLGAHSGSYHLLRFDGDTLQFAVVAFSSHPGVGHVEDLNGDGLNEVVLDRSEPYIFCYACGVYYPSYQVYTWQGTSLGEIAISHLTTADQAAPFADLNRQAVTFAQADLWPDALAAINAAVVQAGDADPPTTAGSLHWNQLLIQMIHDAQREAIATSAYPLLNHAFYGDYAGAVAQMRAYSPDAIFRTESPLIVGTVAEGWEMELSMYLLDSSERALAVMPDRAEIHFVRAWGRFLADPTDPAFGDDIRRAALLAPDDPLFAAAVRWLEQR